MYARNRTVKVLGWIPQGVDAKNVYDELILNWAFWSGSELMRRDTMTEAERDAAEYKLRIKWNAAKKEAKTLAETASADRWMAHEVFSLNRKFRAANS